MISINPKHTPWRLLSLFTAFTVAISPSMPLLASPAMEQLFGILKAKGSLTAEEHDLLINAMRADEAKAAASTPATSPAPMSATADASPSTTGLEQRLAAQDAKIKQLEANLRGTKNQVTQLASVPAPTILEKKLESQASKVENLENIISSTKGQIEELTKVTDNTSPSTMNKSDLDLLLADKWYERLKLKGYGQIRATSIINQSETGPTGLHVPNDAIANDAQSIGIRRGRATLSGDVTNHLYLYLQMDYFASVSGSNVLQARDYYADVSLDPAREYRIRLGLSKVPYGWSNMQSSQNRLAIERPDAINSAVEGERDFGAYFMWAPYEIRNRFKDLVKMGLRGSGDYGVIALGAFSGQGINNRDVNGQTHLLARLSYPFEFPNGQFLELGIQGYTGKFVSNTSKIGKSEAPAIEKRGVDDYRVALSGILYPQPFGIETEWNWGRGPILSEDQRMITSGALSGGYIQASYRHIFSNQQELIPFIRWQTYDGGRKFATNAPRSQVDEIAVGMRYIPYPEMELSLMYTHGSRTNTAVANDDGEYADVDANYIGIQAQLNF